MSTPTLPLQILGTGEALPERAVSTEEVAALCGLPADEAIKRTGVRRRHWLCEGEDPLEMGLLASRRALDDADLTVEDLDCVINASGTPLQAIPDGGAIMAAALGLGSGFSYSVHATCISFLFALHDAAMLLSTGRARRILIVSTECGSRGLNYAQPESALLIGDAAAAVVVGLPEEPGPGVVDARFRININGVGDAAIRGFGTRTSLADAEERPEDFMFDMRGLRLLADAIRHFPAFLEDVRPGLSSGTPGIDTVIPHQTSRAGMEAMAGYWGEEKLVVTLGEVGNTIASGIPLALHRRRPAPGQTALLVGTGAGTLYGAVILQC